MIDGMNEHLRLSSWHARQAPSHCTDVSNASPIRRIPRAETAKLFEERFDMTFTCFDSAFAIHPVPDSTALALQCRKVGFHIEMYQIGIPDRSLLAGSKFKDALEKAFIPKPESEIDEGRSSSSPADVRSEQSHQFQDPKHEHEQRERGGMAKIKQFLREEGEKEANDDIWCVRSSSIVFDRTDLP